jgi:hypothetical protein
VKYRRLRYLRCVGRIDRRAAKLGRCRKADLIVDDEMDRAARAIPYQAGELERFHHDALTRKGRVAMQEHGITRS